MRTRTEKKKRVALDLSACYGVVKSTGVVEISLSACAAVYRELAQILAAANSKECECRLYVPQKPADPYEGYCRTLRIVWNIGPVRIQKRQDMLLLIGSAYNLETLAGIVADFPEQIDPPAHIAVHRHIEHTGGNMYLDPAALPLVLEPCGPSEFEIADLPTG